MLKEQIQSSGVLSQYEKDFLLSELSERERQRKTDEIYSLLHEFHREMLLVSKGEPLERRAIKNRYVNSIYSLLQ